VVYYMQATMYGRLLSCIFNNLTYNLNVFYFTNQIIITTQIGILVLFLKSHCPCLITYLYMDQRVNNVQYNNIDSVNGTGCTGLPNEVRSMQWGVQRTLLVRGQ
jgi:hypothetical protein